MKILITGAAGFIGSHLADRLTADGHEVVGLDDLSTGSPANFPRGAELVTGDVRIVANIPLDHWDVIYHCAASYHDRNDWERDASVNVLGTINVVREAQRTGARLIYCQTSLCYGPHPASPIRPDAPLAPVGSYAVSKTAGERYIADSGIEFVSLRLANIYGPRNLSGPIPTFWKRLRDGQACTVVDSRRDFVYVADLVRLAVQAASKGRGVYHAATGSDHAIGDLYTAVGNAMGADFPAATPVPRGADDVATLLLDPTDTYLEFGWTARTPLVSGVRAAVDWYASHPVTRTFTHLKG